MKGIDEMKKYIQKITSGIFAFTMITSLSATSDPVFATDHKVVQEQEFIASFDSNDSQKMAKLLMESGEI